MTTRELENRAPAADPLNSETERLAAAAAAAWIKAHNAAGSASLIIKIAKLILIVISEDYLAHVNIESGLAPRRRYDGDGWSQVERAMRELER